MTLSADTSRCAGERTEPHGERHVCARRESCARYIDRHSASGHTILLCVDEGPFSAFIPLSALIAEPEE